MRLRQPCSRSHMPQAPMLIKSPAACVITCCQNPGGWPVVCQRLHLMSLFGDCLCLRRHHAKIVKRHGAAVVVMAFDEQGQAASFDEKV